MVSPPGSSFLAGITGAPVSMKVADKIRAVPHVTAVAPIVMHMITTGALEVLDGIDLNPKSPDDFDNMGEPFHDSSGGPFKGPDDMIVDDFFADQHHVKVGDQLDLLNQSFRICGLWSTARARAGFCRCRRCRSWWVPRARPASSTSGRTSRKSPTPWCRRSRRTRDGKVCGALDERIRSLMTAANLPGLDRSSTS